VTTTHTCTVGPSAVTGERCGAPAITSFTTASGAVFYECADHAPAEGATVPSPAVTQIKHAPRRKLTPHQEWVLACLVRASRPTWDHGWVALDRIGSKQGLLHLVAKGWAEVREGYGPRGGIKLSFRPTTK